MTLRFPNIQLGVGGPGRFLSLVVYGRIKYPRSFQPRSPRRPREIQRMAGPVDKTASKLAGKLRNPILDGSVEGR